MHWRRTVSVLIVALLAALLIGAMAVPVMAGEESPTPEPTVEPTPEPTPEPTEEPTPTPVSDDSVEAPGNAAVTNLKITPTYALPGQAVTVTAEVVNDGQEWATLSAALYINGQFEQTASVGVSAGTSSPVSFTVYESNTGQYNVTLGDAGGVFYVTASGQSGSGGTQYAAGLDTTGIIAIVIIGVMVIAGLVVVFYMGRNL